MAFYSCAGTATQQADLSWLCDTSLQLVDSSQLVNELALVGIDSQTIFYVYTWGMGVVLFMWSLGLAVGAAKNVIKKV